MKLLDFKINHFRSLNSFHVPQFSSTTIFFGDNNAGKSNILHALYEIFRRKPQVLGGPVVNFYTGFANNFANNFYLNDLAQNIDFSVTFSLPNENLNLSQNVTKRVKGTGAKKEFAVVRFDGYFTAKDDPNIAEIILTSTKINNFEVFKYDPATRKVNYFAGFPKNDQGFYEQEFINFIAQFNDCIAIIDNSRDMLPIKFNDDIDTTLVSSSNFKKFLYELYLSTVDHDKFEEINTIFNSAPFTFGEISFAKTADNLEIMIKDKSSIRLPIKHIGSGLLQILFVVTRAVFFKNKIICIEELEQNLSPKKQFELLKKLQLMVDNNYINQIIISSHSSVFSKPKLGTIYLLEKSKFSTTILEKLDVVFKKGFKDHLLFAAVEPENYTPAEWTKNIELVKRLTEEGFRR